jgi:hypothetical protein
MKAPFALILLVAAFVLFVIATIWNWSTGARPLSVACAGLACWSLAVLIGGLT